MKGTGRVSFGDAFKSELEVCILRNGDQFEPVRFEFCLEVMRITAKPLLG